MAALSAATSKKEFEEKLKAIQALQPQNVQEEKVPSSSNYLQSNEDDCYRILDRLT